MATAAAVAVATIVVCDDAIVLCVDVLLGNQKENEIGRQSRAFKNKKDGRRSAGENVR